MHAAGEQKKFAVSAAKGTLRERERVESTGEKSKQTKGFGRKRERRAFGEEKFKEKTSVGR